MAAPSPSPSTTPAPTLAANWAPTAPGCLRTSDYWIWEYNFSAGDARTVVGGPSQTTDCFASTWNPTVTFAGSACPSYYTSACQNADGAVTCCPTVYDFSCQPQTWSPGVHGEWFRCVSAYTSQDVVEVTRTIFTEGKISEENRVRQTGNHLFALALMYTTPPSTSLSSTSSSPTPLSLSGTITPSPTSPVQPSVAFSSPQVASSPNKESSGLTPGAAAGIGIGSAAVVILLALLIWLMYRRRQAAHASATNFDIGPAAGSSRRSIDASRYPIPVISTSHDTQVTEYYAPPKTYTPPAGSPPRELPVEPDYFELDAEQTGLATPAPATVRGMV